MIDSRGFFVTKKSVDEIKQAIANVMGSFGREGDRIAEVKTITKAIAI